MMEGATVEATGAGNIAISGVSSAASLNSAFDIHNDNFNPALGVSLVRTNTGDISITGQRNAATGISYDINIRSIGSGAGDISSSGGGNITLTGNTFEIDGALNITSSGSLTVAPRTAGTNITVGAAAGADPATSLDLNATELGVITDGFGSITIGDVTAGTVTIDSSAFRDDVTIIGNDISVTGAVTNQVDESISLQSQGTLTVSSSISSTGTGAISGTTPKNIVLGSGSSITTVDGGITLDANQQPGTTTGDFRGLDANNSLIQTTGTGNILINATGGNTAYDQAVYLVNTDILSTASGASAGTITVNGFSKGAGAGVRFRDGSIIESVDGDINILGDADNFVGVFFLTGTGGTVRSTGTGANAANITINGVSQTNFSGVQIDPGTITSVDGDIAVIGSSNSGNGFLVDEGSITTTGAGPDAGNILLSGTSNSGNGALFQQSFQVQTVDGDISVAGDGTTGVFARATVGISTTGTGANAGNISVTGTGSVTDVAFDGTGPRLLTADGSIAIEADTLSLGATVQGGGNLLIKPRTASTSIGLGGGAGTLNLDDTELGFLADGFSSITIGDAAAGTGAVDVDSSTFTDNVTIVGGSIDVTELNAGGNGVTLTARTGAITDGGDVGIDVAAASLVVVSTSGVGTSGNALETAVGSLSADGGSGGVFIAEADSLTLENLNPAAPNLLTNPGFLFTFAGHTS